MAQTGYTPISIYYSSTASNTPTAGNLVPGELAINTADGKLFYKDSAGVVQTIASKGTGTIGGSTTQVQYNSSGAFAGSSNMTFDGTKLTVAGLKDSALTSGRVTYATTSGELTDSANMTFNGTTLTANTLNLTNALGVAYGGTGLTSLTAGYVPYGNGTSALSTNVNFNFNGTNLSTPAGIQIVPGSSSLYASDGALSYYATNNGVYLNGTAQGFLGLRGDGSGNAGSSIQINGGSYSEPYLIKFFTNSTERLRLVNSGTVILQGANTAATGTGITFPATQSASSDANTLDDYEEGTWAPTIVSAGATITYITQAGSYIKIGQLIYAQFYLNATVTGTAAVGFGNLPFSSISGTYYQSSGFYWQSGATPIGTTIDPNATTVTLWLQNAGSVTTAKANNITGTYLVGTLIYRANA